MVAPQLGFPDEEQLFHQQEHGRQRFLDERKITLRWKTFLAMIEPLYVKPSSKRGRRPIPLAAVLIQTRGPRSGGLEALQA